MADFFNLPRCLSGEGHKVLVIAVDYYGKNYEQHSFDGVDFHVMPWRGFRSLKSIKEATKIAYKFSPDVVIGSSDIHFGLLSRILAKSLKVKFVFDVFDFFEEFSSAKIPGFKNLFRKLLRQADLISCVSSELKSYCSLYNDKVIVVPNGIEDSLFFPEDKSECRATFEIPENMSVVGYFGSISIERGVQNLIQACSLLREEGKNLLLLLAGRNRSGIDISYPWIKYTGEVSQPEVRKLIAACDVATIPYLNTRLMQMVNSYKVVEYLACKRPIVTTKSDNFWSSYPNLIDELGGAVARDYTVTALKDAVEFQLDKQIVLPIPEQIYWDSIAREFLSSLKEIQD